MTDENDVDALLASLTNDSAKTTKNKPASRDSSQFDSFGERVGGFKIDPRDSYITGTDKLRRRSDALAVDPNDFTNQVEINRESKRKRNLIIGVAILVFTLVLGSMAWNILTQTQEKPVANPQADESAQRFLNLYPDAPNVSSDELRTLTVDSEGLTIKDGYRLNFPGMNFKDLQYKAVENTDFGPAAVAQVEGPWNSTTVYLFKDMAHTKAFANAWDGEEAQVKGSPASAVMLMEFASGPQAVLAIVNPDSSGFMIVLPTTLGYADAEGLQNTVSVEPSPELASKPTPNLSEVSTVTPANFESLCRPEFYASSPLNIFPFGYYNLVSLNTSTGTYAATENSVSELIGVKDSDDKTYVLVKTPYGVTVGDSTTNDYYKSTGKSLPAGVSVPSDAVLSEIQSSYEYKIIQDCLTAIESPLQGPAES